MPARTAITSAITAAIRTFSVLRFLFDMALKFPVLRFLFDMALKFPVWRATCSYTSQVLGLCVACDVRAAFL